AGKYPGIIKDVRGLGMMLGVEFAPDIPALTVDGKTAAAILVNKFHAAGLLLIPAGAQVVRLLPALNLRRNEAEESLNIIENVVKSLH
ncbi:MAG TPA: aminotransferase class III-fold pyridoxal phosphate-dependent enzyme, partial [Verrucomicrobiota bacterium]|nr:aminotransferase class III-fold pyridoxal phosphate-dependent enzyme [Verrucomicrobiota bacterium]